MPTRTNSPPRPAGTAAQPFLLLPENRFAHAVVSRLSARPVSHVDPRQTAAPIRSVASAQIAYIFGPSGVGKSHLVAQFVRNVRRSSDELNLVHTTAAAFAAEFAEASESQTIPDFQQRMRAADVFVCEDLHAIQRRPETQQQLIAVVDAVLEADGRCLFTARCAPGELEDVSPRLVSRIRGGAAAAVESPDDAGRASLLAHFARTHQVPVPMDVCHVLSEALPVSPRELLAVVVGLDAAARHENAKIDRALAERCLRGEVVHDGATLGQVARAVAKQFAVRIRDMRAATREKQFVLPRQCAMYLARSLTDKPLTEIAGYFGRRNHSTVIHACRMIRKGEQSDPILRKHLADVRRRLQSPLA